MKTTFDLPESLLRKAKAAAAHQGRPLRDLVADAIEGQLAADAVASRRVPARGHAWKTFLSGLKPMPDGSHVNPEGIDDLGFFEALDDLRTDSRAWQPRDPFGPPHQASTAAPTSTRNASVKSRRR